MNLKQIVCILTLSIFGIQSVTSSLHAQARIDKQAETRDLSPYEYLYKLSKTLTGTTPSKSDFVQLKDAIAIGQTEKFFALITDQYLNSDYFNVKMVDRVRELFRIPGNSNEAVPSINSKSKTQEYDGTFAPIILGVVAYNQSWDAIFQSAAPITSRAFLAKYPTSDLNKNRKRAAVIYRTMLCDSMIPAVEIEEHLSEQEINKLLPTEKTKSGPQLKDDHAARADCQACHIKLDSMAPVIPEYPRTAIPPYPTALVFNRLNSKQIIIEVDNLEQLMKTITFQPEYLKCQTQHFYEWFVGPREELTPETEKFLMSQFENVKRKPKDFIKVLIGTQEFRTKSYKSASVEQKIRATFNQCNSCHASRAAENPFIYNMDLTWLIDGKLDAGKTKELVGRLRAALDGTGKNMMPPSYSNWQLTTQQRSEILAYIKSKEAK